MDSKTLIDMEICCVMCASCWDSSPMIWQHQKHYYYFYSVFLLTNNSTTSKGKFNTILSGIVGFCNRLLVVAAFFFLYHSFACFISLDDMTRGKREKFNKYFLFFFIHGICDGKQKIITWKNSLLPIGVQVLFEMTLS